MLCDVQESIMGCLPWLQPNTLRPNLTPQTLCNMCMTSAIVLGFMEQGKGACGAPTQVTPSSHAILD